MHEMSFEEALDQVLVKDARFHRDAYLFVRDALEFTKKKLVKDRRDHVSGQELLAGIRDCALAQFGPMTLAVFEEWGLRRCEDFGEIVFNLVDVGQFGKTDADTRSDFEHGYDFHEVFRKPFLPQAKLDVLKPAAKPIKA